MTNRLNHHFARALKYFGLACAVAVVLRLLLIR